MVIVLSWATAEAIDTDLVSARTGLDECARSAPSSVDAGEATPLVAAMLARVSESAAGLSEGLAGVSGNVRSATRSLFNADVASQQTFVRRGP